MPDKMRDAQMTEPVKMISQDNPFEYLRPVMRSEEDDIRKGVFSTALRNLAQSTLEEKRRWCHTIRESAASRRGARHTAELHTRDDANALCSGAGRKRRKTCITGDMPVVCASHGNDKVCMCEESDAVPTLPTEEVSRTQAEAMPVSVEAVVQDDTSGVRDTPTTSTTPESTFTAAEAGEYIATFMRALLDRVVGGSLNNLSAPALRVLCYMLRIDTSARSKETLYNILANFYYTHCEKLGKRVSRSTFVASQASHEAQMMKEIAAKGSAGGRRRHVAPSSEPTETSADGAPASASHVSSNKYRTMQTPNDMTPTITPSTSVPQTARTELCEAAEVTFAPRLFARPEEEKRSAASVRLVTDSSAEWTTSELERKVASIVQVYDPVTVAIVTKKLAQMGYTGDNVYETVDTILKRFHQRQLIFYDSGIAYLM